MKPRKTSIKRETKETSVEYSYELPGEYLVAVTAQLPVGEELLEVGAEAMVVVDFKGINFLAQPENQEVLLGREAIFSTQIDRTQLPAKAKLIYEWNFGDEVIKSGGKLVEIGHVYLTG